MVKIPKEEGHLPRHRFVKGNTTFWGAEQELVVTSPPASLSAVRWEDLLLWNCVRGEALSSLCCSCFNPRYPFLFPLFVPRAAIRFSQ